MLLGTKYRAVRAIPPRFCTHAWLCVAVEVDNPTRLVAIRVFKKSGPFVRATNTVYGLLAQALDYVVPHLGSEIGPDGLLYVFEDFCYMSIRDVTAWTIEDLRCYLFQALFGVYALRKFHNLAHGNLHRGNLLLFHEPTVTGRNYLDGDDTWRVDYHHSIRFSDFSCSREDGPSDLPQLESSFNKVPLIDGSTQDRAMLADVRRKMRQQIPPERVLRHNFFYKFRTFEGVDHFPFSPQT